MSKARKRTPAAPRKKKTAKKTVRAGAVKTEACCGGAAGVVAGILEKYPREPASLISVLQDVQEEYGYLPKDALDEVCRGLGTSRSRAYHVATFFKAFSLKPRGKHLVSVCMGTACHVKGAGKVLEVLESELGVKDGGTSPDNLFTLKSVRCLGCCSLAPAVMIDGKVYGGVTTASVGKIVNSYKDGKG